MIAVFVLAFWWLGRETAVIAEQQAPAGSALNLKAGESTGDRTPAPRKGTIDETIDAVVGKHYRT